MAKRRKTRSKTHHRRRGRIGAVGHKFNLMDTLETGLGLVIGTMGATMMQKYLTVLPQKAVSAIQLVGGVMFSNSPNKIMSGAAWGVAGAGALGLAHETGVMHGIDETISGFLGHGGEEYNYREDRMLNGMGNDETLAGMRNGDTLAGAGGGDEDENKGSQEYYPMVQGY